MFKKIITLLCILISGTFTYATTLPQEVQDEMKEINDIIFQQVNQTPQEISFYNFVKENIEQYYERKRKDFKDDKKTTGWFRVDRFLNWVKQNEKQLQNSSFEFKKGEDKEINYSLNALAQKIYKKTNKSTYAEEALWMYLGARYVENIYNESFKNFYNFKIIFSTATIADTHAIPIGDPGIKVTTTKSYSIPMAINLGIHETTHLLPILKDNQRAILPELATFYAQYNFGLPVKNNYDVKNKYYYTTRDVRRLHSLKPDIPFTKEYNAFIAGLIINNEIDKDKLFNLKETEIASASFPTDITIQQAVFALLAAEDNRFMYGKPKYTTEITKNTFLKQTKLFNIGEKEAQKILTDAALDIDLGNQVWPGTSDTVPIILRKKLTDSSISFLGGKYRINKKMFLEKTFGQLADNPKLQEFYEKLIEYLPQEIKQNRKKFWPVVTNDGYLPLLAFLNEERLGGAKAAWEEAIIKALNDVTTDTVPVPEGYL